MEQVTYDFSACVKALSKAFGLSCRALQSELSVSLYVFHTLGGTSNGAKRELRQVYADAGRPCLNHAEPAYQTVMRRIGRSAALFDRIGSRKIAKAIGKTSQGEAITALVELLAPLGLTTMDQVGIYVGQVAEAKQAPAQPDTPEEGFTHVKTRHIDVAIPPDTPARELVTLANKLLKMAHEMEVEA